METIIFPKHLCLHLEHNQHKACYETVEQWLAYYNNECGDWVSEEQKQKAIATDSCWSLKWYPDNPIGSYRLLACDLDVLLKEAADDVGTPAPV